MYVSQVMVKKLWYVNTLVGISTIRLQQIYIQGFLFVHSSIVWALKNTTENKSPQKTKQNAVKRWIRKNSRDLRGFGSGIRQWNPLEGRSSKHWKKWPALKVKVGRKVGERDLLKKTSRCYAKGPWGFYFASDIDIKAMVGFGEQSGMAICFCS